MQGQVVHSTDATQLAQEFSMADTLARAVEKGSVEKVATTSGIQYHSTTCDIIVVTAQNCVYRGITSGGPSAVSGYSLGGVSGGFKVTGNANLLPPEE
eukprot:jgi/Chlat1/2040/Chrsp164S02334